MEDHDETWQIVLVKENFIENIKLYIEAISLENFPGENFLGEGRGYLLLDIFLKSAKRYLEDVLKMPYEDT